MYSIKVNGIYLEQAMLKDLCLTLLTCAVIIAAGIIIAALLRHRY